MSSYDNAAACRAKAVSLRESAREASSAVLSEKFLDIAKKWDELAADYEIECAASLAVSTIFCLVRG